MGAERPLFRGVRGKLPSSFWQDDHLNMVCITDTAFMSTSRNQDTPISYMADSQNGSNVLWELKPGLESDSAYHYGADISMLSQFSEEREVLFPPCSLLTVSLQEHEIETEGIRRKSLLEKCRTKNVAGKIFVAVEVKHSFV